MANIANLLTEHMAIWTAADTEKKSGRGRASGNAGSVFGVKKLRELILELAVRGKLVPQDPNDEPASELLKRIQAEKAKLRAEGKLKKGKPLAPISTDEKPFELPKGWEFSRFSYVANLENGDRGKNYPNKDALVQEGIPFVNAGHLENGFVNKSEMTFITEQRYNLLSGGKFVEDDILFCLRGSLGKCAVVKGIPKGAIASSLVIIRVNLNIHLNYFYDYLISNMLMKSVRKYDNGTAQPNLSSADLANFVIPIPPINEQHRIVAKVDELMALCDQLEQQHSNAQEAHETLVSQLLATLTQSQNAAAFNANWQRIYAHFDVLFTTEASIDALKQTLLQLAVMGKLVPQEPNDEPAKVLITRAKDFFKEEFETELIKLSRDESIFNPESYHFSLPKSWVWCELQDISMFFNGKAHEMFVDPNGKYTLVNSSFISNDGDKVKKVSECLFPLEIGDIAIVMSDVPNGRALVRCFKVDETKKYSLNQRIGCLRFPKFFDIDYLRIVIERNKYYLDYDDGKKQTNLKKIQVLSCPIPLPPIDEQHRIVAKVDALMALCDQLKTRIQQANQQQQAISDALVAQAVA